MGIPRYCHAELGACFIVATLLVFVHAGGRDPYSSIGFDTAAMQDYTVDVCDGSTAEEKLPEWCRWVERPASATRHPASTMDDSMGSANEPLKERPPLFRVQETNTHRRPSLYITSNGFASLTPFLHCWWYCYEYTYETPGSDAGVNWPMVALFNTDLNPSSIYGNFSRGIFVTNDTVWYENVALFSVRGPVHLNLTASMTVDPEDGSIIMRYKSVPAPPNATRGDLRPIVGLFLSKHQRINVPANEWVGEPPAEPEDATPDKLLYRALRFRQISNIVGGQGTPNHPDVCRGLHRCGECQQLAECAWCWGYPGRNTEGGLCVQRVTAGDFCALKDNGDPLVDTCDKSGDPPSYTTEHTSLLRADDTPVVAAVKEWGAYTKHTLNADDPDATVVMSFNMKLFGVRDFNRLMIKTNGQLIVHGDYPKTRVVLVNALAGADLNPFYDSSSITAYALPSRKRGTSTICDDVSASQCGPAVAVIFQNMTSKSTHLRPDRSFGYSIVIHSTGDVQMYFDYATAPWDLPPAASSQNVSDWVGPYSMDITEPAQLFYEDQPIAMGLTLGEQVHPAAPPETVTHYPLPWASVGQGRTVRLRRKIGCEYPCQHGGSCDFETGTCQCINNYGGSYCAGCAPGYYVVIEGVQRFCLKCANCMNGGTCNEFNGGCNCPHNTYGPQCENICPHSNTRVCNGCNSTYGVCECGECRCVDGYEGPKCDQAKPPPNDDVSVTANITLGAIGSIILLTVVFGCLLRHSDRFVSVVSRCCCWGQSTPTPNEDPLLTDPTAPITPQPRPPNMHLMSAFGVASAPSPAPARTTPIRNPLLPDQERDEDVLMEML